MSDLLQSGLAWLAQKLKQHASRQVTYERGVNSVVLLATPAKTQFEQSDTSGLKVDSEIRDFLIAPADLVLAGEMVLPERGDLIRESDGSTLHLFEVVPVGGEPPYRYTDPYRNLFRIHVREIDTEQE
ncbi:MAG: hypothetical protein HY290_33460 [Planctomycetia bacterium]|nr:hypothetical protein [Planctomycetia bacterium]